MNLTAWLLAAALDAPSEIESLRARAGSLAARPDTAATVAAPLRPRSARGVPT
jgi:hypothetical protein